VTASFPRVRRLLTLGGNTQSENGQTHLKMVCAPKQVCFEGLGLILAFAQASKMPRQKLVELQASPNARTPQFSARVEATITAWFSLALQQIRQDDEPTNGKIRPCSVQPEL
jgi:hypothetical protein